ncbi:MAG: response regulator [Chitinophagaceae bacterium]
MNSKTKVLIVDDSPELLGAVKLFLETKSYEVNTIADPRLLVAQLKHNKPDIAILDIFLNGMGDGREICRSLKSDNETKNIPVILMSSDYKVLEYYKESLADAMIPKPFKIGELIQVIESLS